MRDPQIKYPEQIIRLNERWRGGDRMVRVVAFVRLGYIPRTRDYTLSHFPSWYRVGCRLWFRTRVVLCVAIGAVMGADHHPVGSFY